MDVDFLPGRGGGGLQGPRGLIDTDRVGEVTLKTERNRLAFLLGN